MWIIEPVVTLSPGYYLFSLLSNDGYVAFIAFELIYFTHKSTTTFHLVNDPFRNLDTLSAGIFPQLMLLNFNY